MHMQLFGKIIFVCGLVCVCVGAVLYSIGKLPGGGRLPGDIYIEKENFTFYFPVVTCIIVSIVVSFFLHIFTKR